MNGFYIADVCVSFRVTVYNNGTLRITQVKVKSTGQYKCVAHYGNDKQVHAEAILRIAGKFQVLTCT